MRIKWDNAYTVFNKCSGAVSCWFFLWPTQYPVSACHYQQNTDFMLGANTPWFKKNWWCLCFLAFFATRSHVTLFLPRWHQLESPVMHPGKLFKGSRLNWQVLVCPSSLSPFSCLECECDVWSFSSHFLTMSQLWGWEPYAQNKGIEK